MHFQIFVGWVTNKSNISSELWEKMEKLTKILICALIVSFWCSPSLSLRLTKTTSFKCTSSNKSISSYNCFAKSYSRNFSTFNFIVNVSRPLYRVKVCKISCLFNWFQVCSQGSHWSTNENDHAILQLRHQHYIGRLLVFQWHWKSRNKMVFRSICGLFAARFHSPLSIFR